MSCKCARATDEWHGWECEITEGACMFLHPDSKACAELYGEGPDAGSEEDEINLYPTKCNLCGGKVIFTSNSIIYGKEYGSGKCYYCTECNAYVGTHKPRPREALGILANKEMRELKKKCHLKFDKLWKGKRRAKDRRHNLYGRLAGELQIPLSQCHFGYFDTGMLLKALEVLDGWKDD
ncbi:MAG: zinc-finger-containing protein [Lachnospiraceae bacterium]